MNTRKLNLHLSIATVSTCTAKMKHKFAHTTKYSTTQLWICLLSQPNTNCTKIEIDRKIGDLTCLREYAESLCTCKADILHLLFSWSSQKPTYLIALQISMWWCLSLQLHFFALFPHCLVFFHAKKRQQPQIFHTSQTVFQTLFHKREDEIDIGQYSLNFHHIWSSSGFTQHIFWQYSPLPGLWLYQ